MNSVSGNTPPNTPKSAPRANPQFVSEIAGEIIQNLKAAQDPRVADVLDNRKEQAMREHVQALRQAGMD